MLQVERIEAHDHVGHGFGGEGIAAGYHHVVLDILPPLRPVAFSAPESLDDGIGRRVVGEQIHVAVLGIVLVVLALGGAIAVRPRG